MDNRESEMEKSPPTPEEEERVLLTAIGIDAPSFEVFEYELQDPWLVVARQYLRATEQICMAVNAQGIPFASVAFPALFCFRHAVELSFKVLTEFMAGQMKTLDKPYRKHNLDALKNKLNDGMPSTMGDYVFIVEGASEDANEVGIEPVSDSVRVLLKWAKALDRIDVGSDRFRYPISKEDTSYDFPDLSTDLGLSSMEDFLTAISEIQVAVERVHYFLEEHHESSNG